jgi:hypothetical protein
MPAASAPLDRDSATVLVLAHSNCVVALATTSVALRTKYFRIRETESFLSQNATDRRREHR